MMRGDFVTWKGTLRLCHSRAWLPREGIPMPGFGSSHSKPRSRHPGLIDSITLIFCLRDIPLMSFSRPIRLIDVSEILEVHEPVDPISPYLMRNSQTR